MSTGDRSKSSRIHQLKDMILFKAPIQTCGVNGGNFTYFTVPTPSARVGVSIKLIWWYQVTGQPAALPQPPPFNLIDPFQGTALTYKLNLMTVEQSETGMWIPTGDIVGATLGNAGINGQVIPASGPTLGLGGFSQDVQGGQSAVQGLIVFGATTGYSGTNFTGINLTLRVKYELQGSDMCDDEWADLVQLMNVQAPPPVVFV